MYFAARDIVGTKALYYTIQNKNFYYADDITELLQQVNLVVEPDIDMLHTLLYDGTLPTDATLYKSIKRLPAAHYMTVDIYGQCKITRYWTPENIKIDESIKEEEAKIQFLALLKDAINDRIDDLTETSFDLSGGLDSSSVIAMVKQIFPENVIETNSEIFPSISQCDEDQYIKSMSEKFALNTNKIRGDNLDYNHTYSLEAHYKQRPSWPILLTYMSMFSVAKDLNTRNIKKVLTGHGGDDILTGNGFVIGDYFKSFQWKQLFKELKAVKSPVKVMKKYALLPLLREHHKDVIKTILFMQTERSNKNKVVQESSIAFSRDSLAHWHDLDTITCSMQSLTWDISPYHEIKKRYGIVYSHPFFDRRLVEFMLSLPAKYKYREGVGKILLRKAMKGLLPEMIRQRKDKAEFSEIIKQQINAIDLDKLLDDPCLVKLGLIDQRDITKLKEDYQGDKMKSVAYFWRIINIEYWYRYNFDTDKEQG